MLTKKIKRWLFIVLCLSLISSSFLVQKHDRRTALQICENSNDMEVTNRKKEIEKLAQKLVVITSTSCAAFLALSTKPSIAGVSTKLSELPEITSKVFLNIKIANYTEESVGTNQGAYGSGCVIIGLFGKNAPLATKQFLEIVDSDGTDGPSFIGGVFSRIEEETQLLELNPLVGLNEITIAGRKELEYNEKVLNYTNIVDISQVKHDRKGLLTRRQLSNRPEFSITTAPNAALDTFHTVFGVILEGMETLDVITALPRYSSKTRNGYLFSRKGQDGGLADSWFQSQRSFYLTAGRILGDSRAIDRTGKLLRRVQIIDAGILQ